MKLEELQNPDCGSRALFAHKCYSVQVMITEIDALMRLSLTSLTNDLSLPDWTKFREHEAVSVYCFCHLLKLCRADTFLHDPAQIVIEGAVPQVADQASLSGRATSKKQVCKDIVIWPRPRMTCWDTMGAPTIKPACIIEWKHGKRDVSSYDVKWLKTFSVKAADFVGYAVCTNLRDARNFRLSCTRIHLGQTQAQWLFID